MPREIPPRTTPQKFPKPPMMAAQKPFKPIMTPISYWVMLMGAMTIPAAAPTKPLRPKEMRIMNLVSMPTSLAALG